MGQFKSSLYLNVSVLGITYGLLIYMRILNMVIGND